MNITNLPRNMQNKIRVADSGCWEWIGARNSKGYGSVGVLGSSQSTHRVAYELLVGTIPEGLQIDHLCRNKACCNPEHLEPVTALVNTRRRPDIQKTHCIHGHEMTAENTVITRRKPDGYSIRVCRICKNDNQRSQRTRPMVSPNALADDARQHGTTHGYSYFKCRCDRCRRAFADYMREYRARKSA